MRFLTPWDPSFVVRGNPEIAKLPLDPQPYFDDAFASDDSAALFYTRFATQDERSDVLRSVSNVLLLVGFTATLVRDDTEGWPTTVGIASISLRLVAELFAASARRNFRDAAAVYNRTLREP